ncbi:hypothetical protein NDU88_001410 [Pleurodeles waltl]|uniref:Uncharacterized protein n=1 Tax=Pleurodeles waltl TaxID=8319 RepID=A0AAV7V7Q9_PLEWA|nr:hypothetical protein NDU88_001410 [Pleurodeles waltl]
MAQRRLRAGIDVGDSGESSEGVDQSLPWSALSLQGLQALQVSLCRESAEPQPDCVALVPRARDAGSGFARTATRKGGAGHTGKTAFPTHPLRLLQQMLSRGRSRVGLPVSQLEDLIKKLEEDRKLKAPAHRLGRGHWFFNKINSDSQSVFQSDGFLLNYKKSKFLRSQSLRYIGAVFQTQEAMVFLPEQSKQKLTQQLKDLLQKDPAMARD